MKCTYAKDKDLANAGVVSVGGRHESLVML
jgi:hypothetical protein